MSNLQTDRIRQRESRRRKKPVVADTDDSEEEEEVRLISSPRSSAQAKKATKSRSTIVFKFEGDVSIKGDVNFATKSRDKSHRQLSPVPIKASSRQLQNKRSRPAPPPSETQTEIDDDLSPESESEPPADRSPRKSRTPKATERLRPKIEQLPRKRSQPDEGYHTSSTASASYTAAVTKAHIKGKGRSNSSNTEYSSTSALRYPSSLEDKRSQKQDIESDATDHTSEDEQHDGGMSSASEGGGDKVAEVDDEDSSDDDFGKLPIKIGGSDGRQCIDEKAVLDTGTKPDWISQTFYNNEIKKMGIKAVKLGAEDQTKYRDFNGREFRPKNRIELMIRSDEFGAMGCATLSFLVASDATFNILFGRDTIRKHDIFHRGKPDTDGRKVLPGIMDKASVAEKAEMKRRKEEQRQLAQKQKEKREAKVEDTAKRKENFRAGTNLASVARNKSKPERLDSPRTSESSLEGTW